MKNIIEYINENKTITHSKCKTEVIENVKLKKELSVEDLTKFDDNYVYDVFLESDTQALRAVKKDFNEENRDYAIFFVKKDNNVYDVNIMIHNDYYESFMENDMEEIKTAVKDFNNNL